MPEILEDPLFHSFVSEHLMSGAQCSQVLEQLSDLGGTKSECTDIATPKYDMKHGISTLMKTKLSKEVQI
jgi:hypothetical protein